MYFKDRNHAGEVLAEKLVEAWPDWKSRNPIVIALPRGGVPVAYPIARRLDAPLEILLVKKPSAPANPEYALGAVAEDGRIWLNREAVETILPAQPEMDELTAEAVREMRRQQRIFRSGHSPISLEGRAVLLVDDGLATGSTLLAALASVQARGASEVRVAVPVASREALRLVKSAADEVYAAEIPTSFRSVSQWYERFGQVSDQEVIDCLRSGQEVSRGPIYRGSLRSKWMCGWMQGRRGASSFRVSSLSPRIARRGLFSRMEAEAAGKAPGMSRSRRRSTRGSSACCFSISF